MHKHSRGREQDSKEQLSEDIIDNIDISSMTEIEYTTYYVAGDPTLPHKSCHSFMHQNLRHPKKTLRLRHSVSTNRNDHYSSHHRHLFPSRPPFPKDSGTIKNYNEDLKIQQ